MGEPRRIQRRRRRGWRMPEGAVYVGRPTIWGNPFRITRSSDYHGLPGSWFLLDDAGTKYHPDEDTERSARQRAVELFARQVLDLGDARVGVDEIRARLAGRDLVCWCPSDEPCHADVLLAIANEPAPVTPGAPVSPGAASAPDAPAPSRVRLGRGIRAARGGQLPLPRD